MSQKFEYDLGKEKNPEDGQLIVMLSTKNALEIDGVKFYLKQVKGSTQVRVMIICPKNKRINRFMPEVLNHNQGE